MNDATMNQTELPSITQPGMHFRVLDSWRGIAALLVALFHLNILSAIYSLDFIRNGYLFVDFFFVLSGFVISHTYGDRLQTPGDLTTFIVKRIGRLWPLHVVVLLAFVAVEGARAYSASRGASFYKPPFTGDTSPWSILVNLVFGQSFGIEKQLTWNPPSWSICAEFWTYIVFAVALFVASNWLRRFRFASEIFIAAILAGGASFLMLFAEHGIDATFDLGLVRCIYGFFVGHLTYRFWQTTSLNNVKATFLEESTLFVAVGFVSIAGHSASSFAAPLVFAVVVFVFAFESGPISGLLLNRGNAWLGRISYSIYMWQAFVIFNFVDRPISVIEKMTGHMLTTTEGAGSALGSEAGKLIVLGGYILPIVVTLLFTGLLVVVAGASYYLIEKPGQKLFARFARWLGRQISAEADRQRIPAQSAEAARSRRTIRAS